MSEELFNLILRGIFFVVGLIGLWLLYRTATKTAWHEPEMIAGEPFDSSRLKELTPNDQSLDYSKLEELMEELSVSTAMPARVCFAVVACWGGLLFAQTNWVVTAVCGIVFLVLSIVITETYQRACAADYMSRCLTEGGVKLSSAAKSYANEKIADSQRNIDIGVIISIITAILVVVLNWGSQTYLIAQGLFLAALWSAAMLFCGSADKDNESLSPSGRKAAWSLEYSCYLPIGIAVTAGVFLIDELALRFAIHLVQNWGFAVVVVIVAVVTILVLRWWLHFHSGEDRRWS